MKEYFDQWDEVKKLQEDKRQLLQKVSDKWPEIIEMLGD